MWLVLAGTCGLWALLDHTRTYSVFDMRATYTHEIRTLGYTRKRTQTRVQH